MVSPDTVHKTSRVNSTSLWPLSYDPADGGVKKRNIGIVWKEKEGDLRYRMELIENQYGNQGQQR